MDLDLGQVRAFVAAADEMHFGRAAARLFLTQQGLSKRIRALEATLGEPLFERRHNLVELTAAGRRFLPHARRLLVMADEATSDLAARARPLRIDVWGPVQAPLRLVRQLSSHLPQLVPEISMRRNLLAALDALARDDIDAACGRPYDLSDTPPPGLTMQPLYLEPLAVATASRHPFADAAVLTPDDLRTTGIWSPIDNGPEELAGLFHRFATEFDIPFHIEGLNLGLDSLLDAIQAHPQRVTLIGAEWPLPPDPAITVIPLQPVPRFLWWIATRHNPHHPQLHPLLTLITQTAQQESWLAYDPTHDWLPTPDHTALLPHLPKS
jgi:DNA-binding transcriptional LysR family regulator